MDTKVAQLNVRLTKEVYAELRTTARLKGLSVSSLIHMLVVKAIREEKAVEPQAFGVNGRMAVNESRRTRKGEGDWRDAAKDLQAFWKDRDDFPDLRELRRESDERIRRLEQD